MGPPGNPDADSPCDNGNQDEAGAGEAAHESRAGGNGQGRPDND